MKLIFAILLLQSGLVFGDDTLSDLIQENDNLFKIASRNLKKNSLYGKNIGDFAEDIKKWNVSILDWNNPPKGKKVYVQYPYSPYASGIFWVPELEQTFKDREEFRKYFSLNIFYATSFGAYSETVEDQLVKSTQNFPVTLGLNFSSTSKDEWHSYLGSVNWAKASHAKINDNRGPSGASRFSIPGELGGNLYYQYQFNDIPIGGYAGYDYEKLNTFNTEGLIYGDPVRNITNDLHFFTLGALYSLRVLQKNIFFKLSTSRILSSHTTFGKAFYGEKYILSSTVMLKENLGMNFFYKHHTLRGSTFLKIDRIGFGFVFNFFQ